jgi:type III pantothenate kinase
VLLAVDVGNPSTVLGVFQGERFVHGWRLTTQRHATADELAACLGQLAAHRGLGLGSLDGMALASVVPPLRAAWSEVAERYLGCQALVVGPDLPLGLELAVERPQEVGADRIADGLAAWRLYGAPVVVVDLGTATTVDAIAAGGRYLGGVIAPGVGISAEALFQRAALLYRVELAVPARALGTNTVTQMQAGIAFGFAGQVDALVERIRAEMGGAERVVATGGYAGWLAPLCRTVTDVDPLLTLRGLWLAWGLHRGGG